MARDHARLQTAIWNDEDFRNLTADAQHAYFTAMSQPDLSYAGVMTYFPGRLAALAKGNTTKRVETAVKALEKERFLVIDQDTHELLVRTYIRHDGVLARANMGKAMGRALERVVSMRLRQAIFDHLAACYRLDPKAAGWAGYSDLYPDGFAKVQAIAGTKPLFDASGM